MKLGHIFPQGNAAFAGAFVLAIVLFLIALAFEKFMETKETKSDEREEQ